MSLNAHDRHALARIEEELQGADPKFVARLSAFCRLANDEAMPEREQIHGARRPSIGLSLSGPHLGRPRARGLMYAIAIAMAAAITLTVISLALVLGHGGRRGACAQWQAGGCARQATPSAPAPASHKVHAPSLFP
ncbi:MAG: DUF3040 domain-containing protein [Trebonia sp.]